MNAERRRGRGGSGPGRASSRRKEHAGRRTRGPHAQTRAPAGRRPPRYAPAALAALFLFALLWHVAYLGRMNGAMLLTSLHADERVYWDWATYLLHHGFRGSNPFFFGPLYPYVLAAVRAVVGSDVSRVLIVQAVWGSAAAALIADAARRLVGWPVALAAGLLYALYEMNVFFNGLILMESLVLFLEALLIWLWTRAAQRGGGPWTLAAIGAVTGLVSLGRATGALFLIAAWWIAKRREGEATWRPAAARAAAMVAAFFLTVSPAAIHNWAVAREFIPFSYNFGINLFVGNNPDATGRYRWLAGAQGVDTVKDLRPDGGIESDGRDFLAASEGLSLSPQESSSHWAGRAREWMRAHPLDVVRLAGAKLILLWNMREQFQIESADMYRNRAGPLGIPFLGTFLFVAVVGLVGAVHAGAWPAVGPALRAYLIVFTAGMLPFFVTDRYRVHLVPALVMLGAMAVHAWRHRPARSGGLARFALPAALAAALALVPITQPSARLQDMMEAMDMGTRWLDAGQPDLALTEYDRALAIDTTLAGVEEMIGPDPRAGLYFNYGYALRATGRAEEALPWIRRAVETVPTNPKFVRTLADAYLVRGRTREGDSLLTLVEQLAGADGEALLSRGYAAAREGRHAQAESLFAAAVSRGMRHMAAWGALIRIQVQQRALDRARATVERFKRTGAAPHVLRLYEAFVLAAGGERERAATLMAGMPETIGFDPILGRVRAATEEMIRAGGPAAADDAGPAAETPAPGAAGAHLVDRGYDAASDGRFAEAESLFAAAVRANAHDGTAWGALIRVQVQRRALERARASVDRYRQAGAPAAVARLYDAFVLAAAGEGARARAALADVPEAVTRSDPTLGWVRSTTEKMIAAGGG